MHIYLHLVAAWEQGFINDSFLLHESEVLSSRGSFLWAFQVTWENTAVCSAHYWLLMWWGQTQWSLCRTGLVVPVWSSTSSVGSGSMFCGSAIQPILASLPSSQVLRSLNGQHRLVKKGEGGSMIGHKNWTDSHKKLRFWRMFCSSGIYLMSNTRGFTHYT